MKTNEITIIAVFISILSVAAGISIPTGIGVPITLQTLFVILIGLMLKPKIAIITILGYILIGVVGLPVFSGYTSGISSIVSPKGGFLIGFILAVATISLLNKFFKSSMINNMLLGFVATFIIYVVGIVHMAIILDVDLVTVSLWMQVYFVGDLIKIIAAGILAIKLKDRLKIINISKESFNL